MDPFAWKTVAKVALGTAVLAGYFFYKQWLDWSLLEPARKKRSRFVTLIEGLVLACLVFFILFVLPAMMVKHAPH